ncbi:MAG: MFS transporter [Candidatus Limnocylindrales bacterium]
MELPESAAPIEAFGGPPATSAAAQAEAAATAPPTATAPPATTAAEAEAADANAKRSLILLVIAHAVNHSYAVLLPLIFLRIIDEFHVTEGQIAYLAAFGSVASGLVQLSYASLTRILSRRALLGIGGVILGGGFAAQALAGSFGTFAIPNVLSRIGGSPQHPVGNGLLTEQFPPHRRGFAISAHIAGGNVGTVVVALIGASMIVALGWRTTSILFGIPAIVIAGLIVIFIREHGSDRAAALAHGSVRDAFRQVFRDRDLRWLYLTSVLGGGGRGLGVANLFALIYLTKVIGVDAATSGLMYGVLIVFSVPTPLIAGWLSDRVGRKPVIVGVYVGGAIGYVAFLLAGSSIVGLWVGLVIMGSFSFAESGQLQALLADVAPAAVRDTSYAAYFTLAFGVGSLWTALYGVIIDGLGPSTGVPIVFVLMAATFLLAAVTTAFIRERRSPAQVVM